MSHNWPTHVRRGLGPLTEHGRACGQAAKMGHLVGPRLPMVLLLALNTLKSDGEKRRTWTHVLSQSHRVRAMRLPRHPPTAKMRHRGRGGRCTPHYHVPGVDAPRPRPGRYKTLYLALAPTKTLYKACPSPPQRQAYPNA
eukprot:839733-Prymnesium_polylepis.2